MIHKRRSTFKPCLEILEDRCTPSAGMLDPTFNPGGNPPGTVSVVASTYNFNACTAVLAQPSGKVILVGYSGTESGADLAPEQFSTVCLNPDGSLDTSFGSGGRVATTAQGSNSALAWPSAILYPTGNPGDEQILEAGVGSWNGIYTDALALVRFNANGTLDTSFGQNGYVFTQMGLVGITGIVLQPNGTSLPKIVVVAHNNSVIELARYNPNGSLDTSFGSNGLVSTQPYPTGVRNGNSYHLALDPVTNDLIVTGNAVVAAYTANGSLDPKFGGTGIVFSSLFGRVSQEAVAVQPNGDILVAGSGNLARFSTNGSLDTTFGNGGVVTTPLIGVPSLALQSNGQVVLGGGPLARDNANGSPDNSFGTAGIVTPPNGTPTGFLAIQSNGDILAGGDDGATHLNAARYLGEAMSPYFVITGPTSVTAGTAGAYTISVQNPDGSADTGYSGTVQITSSDPQAVLPGNVAITGGTGTFNVTLETAGTQSVAATDVSNSTISGADSGIAVSPAAASQVVFTQEPASGTAGQTLGTVQAAIEDAFGNVETGDNSDQVTLSVNSGPSTQLGGTLTETVAAGIATFSNLLLDTSGSYTLAALASLAASGTLGPVASSSFTAASPVSLTFGSITYSSKTGLYSETVTLTNTTSGTLTGPMSLALTNLPSGVVLTDATGTTNGNPYIRFLKSGKTLTKAASVSITLTFTATSLGQITFGTEVVVGL